MIEKPETKNRGPTELVTGRRRGFRDRYIRHRPGVHLAWRIVVGVVGAAVVVTGLALLPLPGPGWLIIFAGLGILASEFAWAHRLLVYARDQVRRWTHWLGRQSIVVRAVAGLAMFALVGACVWGYVAWQGVPTWLPDTVEAWVASWVPGVE